uniref:LIM zinc-binding domain-containing protein n=1 Tax=Anas platyrhynchos platyrhynchos TaxID=8840 RepID=A0A493TT15_ANAPP
LFYPVQERYCPGLAEEERKQLRAFSARRRREALGQGQECPVPGPCHGCPCKECGRRLNKGDPGISASRLGDHFWHPSCFSCHFCRQPLVDLIYFQQDGRIYCGRHHAELFRPRCASCDQVGAGGEDAFSSLFSFFVLFCFVFHHPVLCAWPGAAGQEEGFLPEPCAEPHACPKVLWPLKAGSGWRVLCPAATGSGFCPPAADFHGGVHRGGGSALAPGAFLLPGVRGATVRAALRDEERAALLPRLLRQPLRRALPGLRGPHRYEQGGVDGFLGRGRWRRGEP